MLTNSHDDAKNKSFMKGPLSAYLSTLAGVDYERLKSLLDRDQNDCEESLQ